MDDKQLTQYAPWPFELEEAVKELRYEPGWRFHLSNMTRDFMDPKTRTEPLAGGLTFVITINCRNAYHPENEDYPGVSHYHPVPAATFNRQSWERWLFDRLMDTVRHESAEWFRFTERRPFAPTHGPGEDCYVLHEYATDDQKNTSFRGVLA